MYKQLPEKNGKQKTEYSEEMNRYSYLMLIKELINQQKMSWDLVMWSFFAHNKQPENLIS